MFSFFLKSLSFASYHCWPLESRTQCDSWLRRNSLLSQKRVDVTRCWGCVHLLTLSLAFLWGHYPSFLCWVLVVTNDVSDDSLSLPLFPYSWISSRPLCRLLNAFLLLFRWSSWAKFTVTLISSLLLWSPPCLKETLIASFDWPSNTVASQLDSNSQESHRPLNTVFQISWGKKLALQL